MAELGCIHIYTSTSLGTWVARNVNAAVHIYTGFVWVRVTHA